MSPNPFPEVSPVNIAAVWTKISTHERFKDVQEPNCDSQLQVYLFVTVPKSQDLNV